MKNSWIHRFTGYLKISVIESSPEIFLNDCMREGIVIWGITYQNQQEFTAYVLLDDLWKLKKLAKHSPGKIIFLEKRGLPFVFKQISARKGMISGFIACLILLVVLSNMVWKIQVDGASPALEHEVRSTIDELGVKKGKIQFFLPSPEEIQEMLMNKMDELTWVGVTRQGASYQFQVVEKHIVEQEPTSVSGNLVSSRKAIIHDIFVEKGKALVQPNQVVEKGDLLVSGAIGKEGNETYVSAKGAVLGEFWYKVNVNVPLHMIFQTVTGDIKRDHSLLIGGIKIPIWGFGRSNFDQTIEETFIKSWDIFGVSLPISHQYTNSYELATVENKRVKEKALEIAREEGQKKLLNQFSNNAEVLKEKVLHQSVEDDKVKISIHFRIIDDIVVKQPIIQGD